MLCMPYPERPSPNLPCLEALVLTPTTVVGGARSRGCGSSCVACMVRYMHACPCIGCGPRSMFVCCRTACLCRPLQPLLGELPLQGGRMGLGCMLSHALDETVQCRGDMDSHELLRTT